MVNFGIKEDLLSVIVRFHDPNSLWQLDQAIFSIANQTYDNVQVVVVAQNSSQEVLTRIGTIIARNFHLQEEQIEGDALICRVGPHLVLATSVPPRIDGRSMLLNAGLKQSSGQYLAFLDYDDVVYGAGYSGLIAKLKEQPTLALSAGAVRVSYCHEDEWFGCPFLLCDTKKPMAHDPNSRSLLGLVKENFITIHCYVVNRLQIDEEDLYFLEALAYGEDYEFLLRICSKYAVDFGCANDYVAEYRQRLDGSNSIIIGVDANERDVKVIRWRRSEFLLDTRRARFGWPTKFLSFAQAQRLLESRSPFLSLVDENMYSFAFQATTPSSHTSPKGRASLRTNLNQFLQPYSALLVLVRSVYRAFRFTVLVCKDLLRIIKRILLLPFSKVRKRQDDEIQIQRAAQIILKSNLFLADYYTGQVSLAYDCDPLMHYLSVGWKLGYDPSPEFSSSKYLRMYADVAKQDINPLVHYVLYGKEEGRIRIPVTTD